MNEQDIRLIREMQKGIKFERRPYLRIAKEIGASEEDVLQALRRLKDTGIIRRIGVAVRPDKAGFSVNALVAWNVPFEQVERVGKLMAEIREISHCYERECPPGWPYNMFTMIHSTSEEHLQDLIFNLKKKCELKEYQIFKTVQELKKTSMVYFGEGHHEQESKSA